MGFSAFLLSQYCHLKHVRRVLKMFLKIHKTFNIGFYAYAIIGHTQADQLLPQLLMEQFDTFPIQCRDSVWRRPSDIVRK